MTGKKILKWAFVTLLIVIIGIFLCNVWIVKVTEDRIFTDFEKVPYNDVALVLGTSNRLTDGSSNPFFENRMKAAANLFFEKKISHFIVSGDNRTQYYNEPETMRRALVELGVPDSVITLDYAGLRTLDSVVRSKEIFGQKRITIITQYFHCYRALFICDYYDIEAVAIIANDPEGLFVPFREYLARAKAVLDLYILKTEPRFLGEKEYLEI